MSRFIEHQLGDLRRNSLPASGSDQAAGYVLTPEELEKLRRDYGGIGVLAPTYSPRYRIRPMLLSGLPFRPEIIEKLTKNAGGLNIRNPRGALALAFIDSFAGTVRVDGVAKAGDALWASCAAGRPGVLARRTIKFFKGLGQAVDPFGFKTSNGNNGTSETEYINPLIGKAVVAHVQSDGRWLDLIAKELWDLAGYIGDYAVITGFGSRDNVREALRLAGQALSPARSELDQLLENGKSQA